MENIRCTVERITYQNEENGWSVLRVNVKGYKDVVTLVGNFCDTKVGAVLAVEGNWRMDAKFGKQFQAVNWKEELPSSIMGIEKYLGSGLIKGIGPVYAKKIVAKFGEETLNIIEEDIQRGWHRQETHRPHRQVMGEAEGRKGHHGLPTRQWSEQCLRRQDIQGIRQGEH